MQYLSGSLSLLMARFRTTIHRANFITVAGGFALLAASAFFISCGGSNANVAPPPVPAIKNINSATSPTSPVGLPIEINGTGFQNSPGQVVFTQASSGITATVTPSSGGWSDTAIAVAVPAGEGTNNFTLPGTVTVAVRTSGGTSNTADLNLIQTLTFDVNNVTWQQATPLPPTTGLTGLRAAAIPVSDTSAYVVTTGGYNGSANTADVFVAPLDPTGNIAGWTASPNALPETIAHHGMVEANPENSLVAKNTAFIYVFGGQVNVGDGANGTTEVDSATFDPTTGAVGKWAPVSSSLPEPLVGPAVTLFNGYVYVIGGLKSDGTPSTDVFSAPVDATGTLGTWTTSPNPYPTAVSFATAFGFAGKLYVLDGDTQSSTDPNSLGFSSSGTQAVNMASAVNGVVGPWTPTSTTVKNRKKQITWMAFGQIIDAEGIYNGISGLGSLELERSQVNPDGSLASFNGITATNNQISANVYNAAAVVSPVASSAQTPRFILIGGQFAATGLITSNVYYNTLP